MEKFPRNILQREHRHPARLLARYHHGHCLVSINIHVYLLFRNILEGETHSICHYI